ncbi:MAG: CRISPR-associated endonuclease Cas1 [Calditrichaeota bacterium]|nr:MAG: CRISPR-associated endonuclease Cas1 [Calditrichota bacterium]
MVLFITEQGSRLVKRGRVLMVYKGEEKLFMYPLENITQLVVMGRVELSTGLMGLLMGSGVDTVLLTRDGRFKGRITGKASKNIFLREAQFRRRDDPAFCLSLSKRLVLAKALNARTMLRRHHPPVYQDARRRLENAIHSIETAPDLSVLRGLEGSFAAFYFSLFPRLLMGNFVFTKRQKHPPPDPVNALLSLGYTLLFNTLYALVEAAGLDPYAGFFHQSSYGHPALVSDLMEPYRAPIVDRLVIGLINKNALTPEDFRQEDGKVLLTEEALKRFVEAYQKRLFAKYMVGEKREALWNILQRNVWDFGKYLQGETETYEPYRFK